MFTSDLAEKFLHQSLFTKPFVFEDVYVGMLADIVNSNLVDLRQNYCWRKIFCDRAFKTNITSTFFFYMDGAQDILNGWNTIFKYIFTLF